MDRITHLRDRYWPVLYWLPFACLAADWGQDPGYSVSRRQLLPPFPWGGIVVAWVVRGAQVVVLWYLLSWRAHALPWPRRLRNAWLYALLLAILWIFILPTHMPGFVVAAAWFAPCTFILLSAVVIALLVRLGYERVRREL